MRWRFLTALALGCGDPDPCTPMCAAATDLYGRCLDDWGVGWSAAGYDNAGDFRDACETWAWEMQHLEREARRRDPAVKGQVDATCRTRRDRFSDPDATCEDFTEIDWSRSPWSD